MPKFNDLDLKNWKDIKLDMNSLWMIPSRKKWGKHDNFYHGNFVPQIPEHFIKRYTKKWWWVLDPFLWSATTAVECEELNRNIIWIDIQPELVSRAKKLIDSPDIYAHFWVGDSGSKDTRKDIEKILKHRKIEWVDLAILHPPYADIIKFTDKKEDLSNSEDIDGFVFNFWKVLKNTYKLLKDKGYMVIVIWDKYQNSEWIPLGFMCMAEAQKLWFKLKSVIVKNMEGNRWKAKSWGIWKYRALNSDYYLFKHEYILVFKK